LKKLLLPELGGGTEGIEDDLGASPSRARALLACLCLEKQARIYLNFQNPARERRAGVNPLSRQPRAPVGEGGGLPMGTLSQRGPRRKFVRREGVRDVVSGQIEEKIRRIVVSRGGRPGKGDLRNGSKGLGRPRGENSLRGGGRTALL